MIINCLKEMFDAKYNPDIYAEVCKKVGLENKYYLNNQNIEDEKVLSLFNALAKKMYISISSLFDSFGEYFNCVFAQKYFKSYYRMYKNAKEFLKAIDKIHVNVGSLYGGSTPPRFNIEEKDNKLILQYKSNRNLIDLVISLIKGVAKFYNEKVRINKIDNRTVELYVT